MMTKKPVLTRLAEELILYSSGILSSLQSAFVQAKYVFHQVLIMVWKSIERTSSVIHFKEFSMFLY